MEEKTTAKHKTLAGKILRILFKTILIIILVFATVALLLLTPPVQNFLRQKATTWLSKKLETKVELGRIYIGFPKNVVLENIYVEDRKKDTLLSGDRIKVDISMLKLLNGEVEVNDVRLSGITAKVKRLLPDTTYNFQFIIDAFATADTTAKKPTDTSAMAISVKAVQLDKIRLVYNDTITGSDMTVWLEHFDTEIDEFDIDNMKFDVPETNISGIRANIYQRKPLVEPEEVTEDTATAAPPPDFDFGFKTINISDIKLDYGNDVSALYSNLDLGKLTLSADQIDLKNQLLALDNIQLDNTTASIRLGKTSAAKMVEEETKQETKQQAESGWKVTVKNIRLNENDFAFTNDNEPKISSGMDYAHLDARDLTLHADDFLFTNDSIAGKITRGELNEQSGFVLNTLQTDFLYASTGAYLHNLLLKTPGTLIKRSIEISYPSLEALQKDIGQMKLDVDVSDSRIQMKDVLTFVPTLAAQPVFANPSSSVSLTGRITGSVNNMKIGTLRMTALNNTSVDVRGTISGLPDANKTGGNLAIGKIQTSRSDIQMMAPKGSLPANITLPENMLVKGNVTGNMQQAKGAINLSTTLGDASINGTISNATDSLRATYDATLVARNLQLGIIMQNDTMFGPLTATIAAKGKGFVPKSAVAEVNANINSAVLNHYTYKDVKLYASLADQKANFNFNVKDPNITIALDGKADIAGKFPSISLKAVVDSINTLPLHFTTDTLMYKGTIAADFANTNPDSLNGKLTVSKSVIAMNGQRLPFDTITVNAGESDSGQFVRITSDILNFALFGKYKLTQLGSVFQQTIDPYYSVISDTARKDTLNDYDFSFTGELVNGPLLKVFMPTLQRLEPVRMKGRFSNGEGFQTNVDAPLIIMGANRIQQLKINAGTSRNAINVRTSLDQFSAGSAMNIYATTLNANIANNRINFLLNLKDVNNKNKYRFGGLFDQPEEGIYTLKINPDSLMLNYDEWVMAADNLIRLNKGDVNIHNFAISRQQQQLSLNSQSENENAPLDIKLTQFRIGTLTAFAKQDSVLIDGVINGNATISNMATQPTFISDLAINDLTFRTDTVGNLKLKVSNTSENIYTADINLTGSGNDIAINGNYEVKPENQSAINLVLDLRKLQMSSVEALSMGAITKASGYLSGKFDIQGTFDKPDVNGQLNFNQTAFTPAMLGSYFRVDNENIKVNEQGITFDSFTILDSLNNKLVLDGNALTTNFINYKFDLNLRANDFQALNSTKQNSKLFYGKFYFDTDLHLTGTETTPKIDGNLKVNEKTDFTVVMPQTEPGVQEREGIVRFVDMDSVRLDTTLIAAQTDTLSQSDVHGLDISVNIEVDKAAVLTLIVDEANGDFLRMKGTAQLTGGIDPSGKTTLTGNYEIEEGAYQISLNLLKREFNIQKGSKITWLGEPTKANVELTAIYVANTAPLSLVENQVPNIESINYYKQKLPFQVKLILGGELLKPEINFDITLPEEDTPGVNSAVIEDVDTRLTELRSQPSELNKQVFALLLLNRFVQENPFASSGDGGFNAGTMARQSVSKLLTEQLNNLAADLISGVDVNFDVASTEDYTTGQMQNRTDLNVSLSKQLLNDRLRVTVGSNFELEGPQQTTQRSNNIAGNVALDYMLSKDGRYMLRAYRKNEFEGELEGYIIETGLNFILSFDYDHFHDLFRRKKVNKDKGVQPPVTNDTRKTGMTNDPVTN